jgi:colicin import membrane protein
MAKAARKIEPEQGPDLSILDEVRASPVIVLTDEKKREQFFHAVEIDAVAKAGTDTSTSAGLDQIKSAAYGVARFKSAIDTAGKAQTEEWRRLTSEVNVNRNVVKAKLVEIQDRVRAPATAWESKEAARKAEADDLLQRLKNAAVVTIADTVESVDARLQDIRGINISDEMMRDRLEMAVDMRDEAVKVLSQALSDLRAQREQAEELARLRAENERREAQEQERLRQEQAKAIEEARLKAERERAEQAAKEAAERAVREAEEKATAERAELERVKQAEIDAANERARRAEEAARLEREKIEADRKAEADRIAAEEEARKRREADQAHRTAVRTKAKDAIMTCGADEETARKIVLAIQAGEVPHVTLTF